METSQLDIARHLAALPLFQAMTAPELERLASGCKLKRFGRGESVFHVGMACEEFHVTLLGQIKLFALSPAGQEKVIELAGPGISFAEALMFTDQPYILNAQALSDSLLLSVSKQAVIHEIQHDPRFAMRMIAGISGRLHGLVHDVQTYTLHSGTQRVIGYLLNALPEELLAPNTSAQPRNRSVTLPVSKATIASRLSITPEYFSRVLHDLEQAGLIRVEKRDIHIPDTERLALHPM